MTEEQRQSWKNWLKPIYDEYKTYLDKLADRIIFLGRIKDNLTVVDAGTGLGLIGFRVFKKFKNLNVIAIDKDKECLNYCREIIEKNNIRENYKLIEAAIDEKIPLKDCYADRILERAVTMYCVNKQSVLNEYYRILKKDSQISLFDVILYDKTFRIYDYLNPKTTKNFEFYKAVEDKVRNEFYDPLTNFDEKTLKNNLKSAGFKNICIFKIKDYEFWRCSEKLEDTNLFYYGLPHVFSLNEKFLKYMTDEQFKIYYNEVEKQLKNKKIKYYGFRLFITALKTPSFISIIKLFFTRLRFWFSYVLVNRLRNSIVCLFQSGYDNF